MSQIPATQTNGFDDTESMSQCLDETHFTMLTWAALYTAPRSSLFCRKLKWNSWLLITSLKVTATPHYAIHNSKVVIKNFRKSPFFKRDNRSCPSTLGLSLSDFYDLFVALFLCCFYVIELLYTVLNQDLECLKVSLRHSERVPWSEVSWLHWDYSLKIRIEYKSQEQAHLHNKLCLEYYEFTINYMWER